MSGSVLLSSCSSVKNPTHDCSVVTRGKRSSWTELAHFTSRSGGETLGRFSEKSLIQLAKAHQVNIKPQSRALSLILFVGVSV